MHVFISSHEVGDGHRRPDSRMSSVPVEEAHGGSLLPHPPPPPHLHPKPPLWVIPPISVLVSL